MTKRLPKIDLTSAHVQRGLILSGVVLVTFYLYFFTNFLPFFYSPRQAEIAELETQIERLTAEVEQAKRTAANLPRLEKEMEELHARWEEATRLLPPEKEVATLLRKVTVAGQQSGVDFLLFEPSEPVPGTFYSEHPVAVRIQGGYHAVGRFLAGLAGLTRIVNVSNLDLKALDLERLAREPDAVTEMTVEAFMMVTAYSLGTEHVEARESAATGDQMPAQPASSHGAESRSATHEE